MKSCDSLQRALDACNRQLALLDAPANIERMAPVAVPAPDLTPPGFNTVTLRNAAQAPRETAQDVVQAVAGVSAAFADRAYDEQYWRRPNQSAKRDAAGVTRTIGGVTKETTVRYREQDLRSAATRPADAVAGMLCKIGGRRIATALAAARRTSAASSTSVTPMHVSDCGGALGDAGGAESGNSLRAAIIDSCGQTRAGSPVAKNSLHGVPAGILNVVRQSAHLRQCAPVSNPEERRAALLQKISAAGPIPAYIAKSVLHDAAGDRAVRRLIDERDQSRAIEITQHRLLTARAMFEAQLDGNYERCRQLAWRMQPGRGNLASETETMLLFGSARLSAIAAASGKSNKSNSNLPGAIDASDC